MSGVKSAGKVAIVTGGGRGIGRAMALGLAEAGVSVTITAAANQDEIAAVAREARDRTGRGSISAIMADVTSETDCNRVVAHTISTFGGLHIVVNNAGRGMLFVRRDFLERPARFWETDASAWRLVVDTNVNGPFLMARAAATHLITQRWGRIINISISKETMGRAGFSPYGPSKAALEAETAIWAGDLEGTGVTVNALLPGGITDTGMVPAEASVRARPGVMLDPSIMVAPLKWLASEASDGVTGRRFIAKDWDSKLPAAEATKKASSPIF